MTRKNTPPSLATLLKQWSLKVRGGAGGRCVVCGSDRYVQAHHILPKERYATLKLEPLNGVALCAKCHKFGKLSAHRNPVWFAKFLMDKLPNVWEWALNHLGDE